MKRSISNLAWLDKNIDGKIAPLLLKYGFAGVDIAPSVYWDNPFEITSFEINKIKNVWKSHGLKIQALQSLLYGYPKLTLFNGPEAREKMFLHLKRMIVIASELGAKALVFGSPQNRRLDERSRKNSNSIALDFFGRLGDFAHKNGETFCLEPNPKEYGCNFINTHAEAIDFVKNVSSKGLAINIDTSAIILNKEPLSDTVAKCLPFAGYVHVSEPWLTPIGKGGIDHLQLAKIFEDFGYKNWISFEMGKVPKMKVFERSLSHILQNYGQS